MNQDLKQYAQLHDENIEMKKEIERLKQINQSIITKGKIEQAAEKQAAKMWGIYKDDVFKHDDIITDLTLLDITKYDFIAGAEWAIKILKAEL